jgi:ornithine cyclodeaminase
MSSSVLVLHEREIRALLDPASCIAAVERALAIYATGGAELPDVIHLDVPAYRGEVHIKAGYLHGGAYYAVKMASGFPENPAAGLSPGNGMVTVFDARTGAPAAVLLDSGYVTDLRTAGAGAVAAKYLARDTIDTVGVIGTGIQARLQLQLLAQVRPFRSVQIWGRRPDAASECVRDLTCSGVLPRGCAVSSVPSVEAAVLDADVVFTVTASRAPLVRAAWLRKGSLVVAVGADGADKQELDVDVIGSADRVVADSLAQCRRIGEIHHALESGVLDVSRVSELGAIIGGAAPGRCSPDEKIVCDLTGVGVQDVAAASLVVQRAREQGLGTVLIDDARG